MSDDAAVTNPTFPSWLLTKADLYKLSREVESLEEKIRSDQVKGNDVGDFHSKIVGNIKSFAELNKLKIDSLADLASLKKHINLLAKHAPVVHMTFASEIDHTSLEKLAVWLRQEVNPTTLISVGLQPSLVGGVYLRTPNKVHDFTIKGLLSHSSDIIGRELEAIKHES